MGLQLLHIIIIVLLGLLSNKIIILDKIKIKMVKEENQVLIILMIILERWPNN